MKPTTLEKYFGYLDKLRKSGATNMFGAGPWLETAFGIDRKQSTLVVRMWMKTLDPNKTPAERAKFALATEIER
jgi:hypothetical protein